MKRSTPKRQWDDARNKVEEEGCCRVCGIPGGSHIDGQRVHIEAAHTIGRAKQDEIVVGPRGGEILTVKPESIIPLCGDCHRQYDARRLDLLAYLTLPEQVNAVEAAGGIYAANERLSGNG